MGMMRLTNEEALEDFLKKHPAVKVRQVKLLDIPGDKPLTGARRGANTLPVALRPPPAEKPPKARSLIEQLMSEQIRDAGLPRPIEWPCQHKPFPDRKYHVDFCWPDLKLILEVDGAVHRIKGTFNSSFERGALLLLAGWRVLHVGGNEVRGGAAIYWLKELFDKETTKIMQATGEISRG